MTGPVYVFARRGVYLCAPPDEEPLPPRVESTYNADAGRYELPTDDDLEALASAVDDLRVVEDTGRFEVQFRGEPPPAVLDDAVLVERDRAGTRLLLPTPADVERAARDGGERVDPGETDAG